MDLKFPRLNLLTVSGRLTRDGELRYTPSGSAVLRCNIAIDDGYWDKQANQWVDRAVFMDINIWGAQAERLNNTLRKGSPVIVEGRLQQHSYTTQDGQNRRITDIYVNKIQSLESNKTDGNSYDDNNYSQDNNYNQNNQSNNQKPQQTNRPEPDFVNDDVPF